MSLPCWSFLAYGGVDPCCRNGAYIIPNELYPELLASPLLTTVVVPSRLYSGPLLEALPAWLLQLSEQQVSASWPPEPWGLEVLQPWAPKPLLQV